MTTPKIGVKTAFLAGVSAQDEDVADLDRILGDHALFLLTEACRKLRISMPTLYRAMRSGRIPYVMNGNRRALTRPVMKRLLREGVGQLANKSI
jgi:excisionase family DNA binding protein